MSDVVIAMTPSAIPLPDPTMNHETPTAPRLTRTLRVAAVACLLHVAGVAAGQVSTDADAHYRSGLGLAERGMHDLAIPEFEAYLAACRDGTADSTYAVDARYALAVCLERAGKAGDAAKELDRVLTTESFQFLGDALLLRARIAFASERPQAALPFLDRLAAADAALASTETAHVLRCEGLVDAGRDADADRALTAALAAFPQSASAPRLLYLRARTSAALGENARAIELLAALRRGGNAETKADPALAAHAALLEASLRLSSGDAASALAALASAERGAPEAIRDSFAYWMGAAERRAGKPREAAARLDAALRAFATSRLRPDMQLELAAALDDLADERAADAYAAFVAAAPDDPRVATAQLSAARALAARARYDEAEAQCAAAIARNADPATTDAARLLLADCAFARGDVAAAEKAYAAFLASSPDNSGAPRATARRGVCLARLGRSGEAHVLLSHAASADGEARAIALDELLEIAVRDERWADVATVATEILATEGIAPARRDEVSLRLGVAASRQNRFDDAIAALTPLARRGNDGAIADRATYELGRALVGAGRPDDALPLLRRAAEAKGLDADARSAALRELAAASAKAGRADDASAALSTLAESSPDALLELGALRLSVGDWTAADRALAAYLERTDDPVRAADAAARRALALVRLNRDADALALVAQRCSRIGDLEASLRTSLRLALAEAALRRGDPAASSEFLAALAADPAATAQRAYALVELARRAYEANDDPVAAARAAEAIAAIADAPESERPSLEERALYLRGSALARTGAVAEASIALRTFGERFPNSTLRGPALLVVAQLELGAGHAAEAARAAEAAAEASSGATLDSALLLLGQARAAEADWARSEAAYAAHRARLPESERAIHAAFGIAWARERQGSFDKAIEAYRAITRDFTSETAARAQFQIGECLYALKRHDDAVREFLKTDVLFAYPEWSAAALYEAGRCLAESGRHDDAARQFADVIRRFPDSRWAESARNASRSAAAPDHASRP
ncbi:MAG: tetratricopeptide repeat protein [Phycisphaerae bacterium]|nr:tetratricopeptide repeat protein [Phycisphaerae bacterium]